MRSLHKQERKNVVQMGRVIKHTPTLKGLLVKHTRDFCEKSSIHGLRYVTETGTTWLQSLIWGCIVTTGVMFCCYLMHLMWSRFQTTPTITAVETINFPVSEVPFPAVTICSVNKVYRPQTELVKKMLVINSNWTDQYIDDFFTSLSNLVSTSETINETYEDIFNFLDKTSYTVDRLMLKLMQRCSLLITKCIWMGTEIDCRLLFSTIKTDEGYCCSFNYHHSNETFDKTDVNALSSRYKDKVLKIAGAGVHTGLTVTVNVDDDNYMSSTRPTPAVLVHVHDHLDFVEMKVLGTTIQKRELVEMAVEPSIIDTTSDVKSLNFKKRKCYFDEEVSLSIGKYGYENCIIECRMDKIIQLCGCIPYYYNVKYYKNNTVRFCRLRDSKCIADNNKVLYTLHSTKQDTESDSSDGLHCECFPTCDVNWYSYSIDVGEIADRNDAAAKEIIVAHVFYSEFSCMKYKQSNLITWDGLFASFGGIFGLCLGGSILSIVEVLYHFTIRLYMTYKDFCSHIAKPKEKITVQENTSQSSLINFKPSQIEFSQTFPQKSIPHNKIYIPPHDAHKHENIFIITKLNNMNRNSVLK